MRPGARGCRGVLVEVDGFEVAQAWPPRRWPRVGRSDVGLSVLTIWGRTRAGRALMVAVRQVGEWDYEILGARQLRPDQVAELEKWEESDD